MTQTFRVTIKMDNAAFTGEDGNGGTAHIEVERILREMADDVGAGMDGLPIRDANGNTVGRWSFGR